MLKMVVLMMMAVGMAEGMVEVLEGMEVGSLRVVMEMETTMIGIWEVGRRIRRRRKRRLGRRRRMKRKEERRNMTLRVVVVEEEGSRRWHLGFMMTIQATSYQRMNGALPVVRNRRRRKERSVRHAIVLGMPQCRLVVLS